MCFALTLLPTDGQICKDKGEAEVWFVGLRALITRSNNPKWRSEPICDSVSSASPHSRTRRNSPSIAPFVCSAYLGFCSFSFGFQFYEFLITY